jgi:hypothetical protein
MTEEHKASRTIVKSPPELWAECSVARSLARHLGEFGEIKVTRLEPETTVAWEGEHASGTVRLEPSGWGTQVTLTATPSVGVVPEPAVDPQPVVQPEPEAVVVEPEPEPEPEAMEETEIVQEVSDHLPGWRVFARLWSRLGRKSRVVEHEAGGDEPEDPQASEEPHLVVEEAPEPIEEVAKPELVVEMPESKADDEAPAPVPGVDHQALLVGALDSLGQAHHRPFSRA